MASEPGFHLLLAADELAELRTALNLLVADERHEPPIRQLAGEVLRSLDSPEEELGAARIPLTPQQMKVTHTAVRLRFDDTQREQADEREVLRRILEKLPDEHTMRAIELE